MADRNQLIEALQNAHAAGDTAAATALATALRDMESGPIPDSSPEAIAAQIKANAPHTLGQKIGMGVGDIPQGINQGYAHLIPTDPGMTSQEEQDRHDLSAINGPAADQAVAARESTWQGNRKTNNEKGFEWGRAAGNIIGAAPLMPALAAAPESLMGAVGAGGFAGGVNAGLMPVTEGDYGTGKFGQVGAGTAGGAMFGGGTNILGSVINGVKSMFLSPQNKFVNNLTRAIGRDGRTIDSAQQYVNSLGSEGTIADLGGNVRGLAEAGATVPGQSLAAAQQLPQRQYGQAERIKAAALKAAGAAHEDELIAKRGVLTKPLYEDSFAPNGGPFAEAQKGKGVASTSYQINDPVIDDLLSQPESQTGLHEGMEALRRENVLMRASGEPELNPMDYALKRNEGGQWEKTGKPNLRMIDAVKRGYDIMLESDAPDMVNPRTGTPTNKARQIAAFRDMLINRTEDQLPIDPRYGTSTWAAARNQWKELSAPIEALNTIDKVLNKARDAGDVTGRLYGSPDAKNKLMGLTQDPAKMAEFEQVLKNEKIFGDTNRAMGNSRTAYRQAAQADMEDGAPVDTMFSLAKSPTVSNAIGHTLMALKQKMTGPSSAVADQMTPMYTNDPAQIAAAFDALRGGLTEREQQTLMGRLIKKGAVPAALMGSGVVSSLMGP